MTRVMLSIHPEYVQEILDGTKKYEYRRKIFKKDNVTSLLVYATRPISAIVCEIEIIDVLSGTPKNIWEKTSNYAGITYDNFSQYFEGVDIAYAIALGKVDVFSPFKALDDFSPSMKTPPQSFVYIDV